MNCKAFGAQAVVTPPIGICIEEFTGFSITTNPVKVQDKLGMMRLRV
jgi:hypothetical protein